MRDLTVVIHELIAVFNRSQIPYALLGGVAVRAYSIPRATYDVDFNLSVQSSQLPSLFSSIEELGYTIPEAYRGGWIDTVGGMPLVKVRFYVAGKSIDADVFLTETPFQRSAMSRRVLTEVEGQAAYVVTAEDLILFKLIADRPRDRIDIADILFTQGELDWHYIETWAEKLGILSRWQAAKVEADDKE